MSVKYSLAVQDNNDHYTKEYDKYIAALLSKQEDLADFGLNRTFSEKLTDIMKKRNLSSVDVYKAARIDRRLFSKIISNKDYTPSKDTVYAIAIALRLDRDHTNDLLSRAGYLISHSDKRDFLIECHILAEIYDIDKLNETLSEFNLKLLGE